MKKIDNFPEGEFQLGLVIPTLGKRHDYLQNLLESISKCNVSLQVVIVCPDAEILYPIDFNKYDFHIQTIRDDGCGLPEAINKGFKNLNSKYWNWIGDDDEIVPNGMRELIKNLEKSPEKVFAWGKCEYVDNKSQYLALNSTGAISAKLIFFGPNLIPQPSCLFRTEISELIGPINFSLKYAFDQDYLMRLLLKGQGIFVETVTSKYRWHAETLTSQNTFQSFCESFYLRVRYSSKKGRLVSFLNILLLPATFVILQFSRFIFRIKSLELNFSQKPRSF